MTIVDTVYILQNILPLQMAYSKSPTKQIIIDNKEFFTVNTVVEFFPAGLLEASRRSVLLTPRRMLRASCTRRHLFFFFAFILHDRIFFSSSLPSSLRPHHLLVLSFSFPPIFVSFDLTLRSTLLFLHCLYKAVDCARISRHIVTKMSHTLCSKPVVSFALTISCAP